MLTQQELDRRRHFITASDVPAILGKSPWRNAADVYWAKVRGTADKTNDAMEAGNMLEPIVLQWADRELGGVLPGDWRVAENGINAASLDGMTLIGEPVEAKTSGITGPGSPHQWGEEGTDEIPDYYLLQVQAQLLVTGQGLAFVPALIGNRGFVMFLVERNDRLIGVIESRSVEFMERVRNQDPPDNVLPSLDTLKRLRREPNKTVAVADDLVQDWIDRQQEAKESERRANEAKTAMMAALGDAERGVWSGGEVTFMEQTRKAHQVAESTFRVLRNKATAKGKS